MQCSAKYSKYWKFYLIKYVKVLFENFTYIKAKYWKIYRLSEGTAETEFNTKGLLTEREVCAVKCRETK